MEDFRCEGEIEKETNNKQAHDRERQVTFIEHKCHNFQRCESYYRRLDCQCGCEYEANESRNDHGKFSGLYESEETCDEKECCEQKLAQEVHINKPDVKGIDETLSTPKESSPSNIPWINTSTTPTSIEEFPKKSTSSLISKTLRSTLKTM